jgi:hypothetical protein
MIRRIRRLYPAPPKIARTVWSNRKPRASTIAEIGQDRLSFSTKCIEERAAMKAFTIATMILALLAAPAYAQGKRSPAEQKKADGPDKKAAEKAYKDALERIPEPKEKYDPWGVSRPAEPAKKPKQAP